MCILFSLSAKSFKLCKQRGPSFSFVLSSRLTKIYITAHYRGSLWNSHKMVKEAQDVQPWPVLDNACPKV